MTEEKKKKNLFEHIGVSGKGMEKQKTILKKIAVFVGGGFVAGLIIDIMLETDKFQFVIPLILILVLLFKWYNGQSK